MVRLVRVWRRHAELLHRESPLLTLTLQHRTKVRMMMMVILVLIMAMTTQVGVVVQYSSSQLTDFTGLLYQDSLSHRHLNLRSDLPHVELHHQHDYRRRSFSRHQCTMR